MVWSQARRTVCVATTAVCRQAHVGCSHKAGCPTTGTFQAGHAWNALPPVRSACAPWSARQSWCQSAAGGRRAAWGGQGWMRVATDMLLMIKKCVTRSLAHSALHALRKAGPCSHRRAPPAARLRWGCGSCQQSPPASRARDELFNTSRAHQARLRHRRSLHSLCATTCSGVAWLPNSTCAQPPPPPLAHPPWRSGPVARPAAPAHCSAWEGQAVKVIEHSSQRQARARQPQHRPPAGV